jgi:hypothetical protein
VDSDLFITRYEALRRRHRIVVIVALIPFFCVLVWFLFLTNYPTRLVGSADAAKAGLVLLALCFGGIGATELAIPILLRAGSLVYPACGRLPRHRWLHRELTLKTIRDGCGTKIFGDDWDKAGAK